MQGHCIPQQVHSQPELCVSSIQNFCGVDLVNHASSAACQAAKDTFITAKYKIENWFSKNANVLFSILEKNAAHLQHKLRPSHSSSERLKKANLWKMHAVCQQALESVPSPRGALVGLSPPNKVLSPPKPNRNMNLYKPLEVLSTFQYQAPPARTQIPPHERKDP